MSLLRDPRHRYSYELRPDPALDARLRATALELEAAGLIQAGAATARRFQPHLTFLRTRTPAPAALDAAATALRARDGSDVILHAPATFASGRIVHVSPSDVDGLEASRRELLAELDPAEVDPAATQRPWIPHVTLSYETLPGRAGDVIGHLASIVPIRGRWGSVECWDLSVRPTVLVHRVELPRSG